MRIAWFTPMSEASAIGRSGASITAALARRAEVEIVCFGAGSKRPAEVPVRVFSSADAIAAGMMATYDAAVYNIGDHLPNHLEIYRTSLRFPGIVVLHDFVMHHFFAGYFLHNSSSPEEYVRAMAEHYGEAGRAVAEAGLPGVGRGVWETDDVARFPLFEEAARGALGVVAHSRFFEDKARRAFPGPVRRLSLAYTVGRDHALMTKEELGLDPDRLVILTIGHVNSNKRSEFVIEAVARLRAKGHALQYVIAGHCEADRREDLERLIRQTGLEGAVRLTGQVSDQELHSYLRHADICVNLRWPTFEGASASAIEQMLYGKPLITGDSGFYADLPDEAAVKIDPRSVRRLTAALARLVADVAERERLGRAAREFAEREFRPETYAEGLLEFIDEVRRARPLLDLTDRLASLCGRIGADHRTGIVDSLAKELGTLFGGSSAARRTGRAARTHSAESASSSAGTNSNKSALTP